MTTDAPVSAVGTDVVDSMVSRAFEIADGDYPEQARESGEREDARWYAMLRALIIDAFNPPDDDVAECSLLADAVAHAFRFIDVLPCRCVPESDPGFDYEPCDRCEVLGRLNDKAIER